MLSRDAVRDAVVEGWNNYYRRQTRQLQEHAHFFDDQADAIMALLPDAETLGRAACEVCGLPWGLRDVRRSNERETWIEAYTKIGQDILEELAGKEREG